MLTTLRNCSPFRLVVFLGLSAVVSTTCSNSMTGPSNVPDDRGSVSVSIHPNPVSYSGKPVTDTPDCADLPHTWYYDQIFTESAGVGVTLTSRVDFFDGFVVNDLKGLAIVIPANGTLTLGARWCSGHPIAHKALSTFSGTDDRGGRVNVTTPTINLQKP
jgi:hypothetical protein